MIEVVIRLLLAAVLLLAAGLKLAQPRQSAAAMAIYGARGASGQWLMWGSAVAAELALAVGVAAGWRVAAYLAAAMMLLFALMMISAILAGRAGASCACFGPSSRLRWSAVARNLVLAAAFILLTLLPRGNLSTEQWLALGLAACFAGLVGLAIAVVALAREVGMLRLRLPPGSSSALEIPQEGPPLGERVEWDGWAEASASALGSDASTGDVSAPGRDHAPGAASGSGRDARRQAGPASGLRLAVFLSEGCHVCRELEPQVRAFARSPLLSAELFDEVVDAAAWRAFNVPGSPYAVACNGQGMALAKGTFNTVAQLESIAATAERRRATWEANIPL